MLTAGNRATMFDTGPSVTRTHQATHLARALTAPSPCARVRRIWPDRPGHLLRHPLPRAGDAGRSRWYRASALVSGIGRAWLTDLDRDAYLRRKADDLSGCVQPRDRQLALGAAAALAVRTHDGMTLSAIAVSLMHPVLRSRPQQGAG